MAEKPKIQPRRRPTVRVYARRLDNGLEKVAEDRLQELRECLDEKMWQDVVDLKATIEREKNEESKRNLSVRIEELRKDTEGEISRLKNELAEKDEALREQGESREKEIKSLKKRFKVEREDAINSKMELQTEHLKRCNLKIEQLEEQISELENENITYLNVIEELRKQVEQENGEKVLNRDEQNLELKKLLEDVQNENKKLRKKMEVEIERTKKRKEVARNHRNNCESEAKQIERTQNEKTRKPKVEKNMEKIKESFVKQRARDITNHANTVMSKEKEIKAWKIKCVQLEKVKKKEKTVQKCKTLDQVEMERIIAQNAKERIQLERHLALATESLQKTAEINVTKYLALEETNQALRQRLLDLDHYLRERENVEKELSKKNEECEEIQQRLKERSELCADLEGQLHNALDKNTELVIQNCDLQQQTNEFERVTKECKDLETKLVRAQSEYHSAKDDVNDLDNKLANLDIVVRQLRETAEKRKELERDHAEALAQLRTKQEEAKNPRKLSDKEKQKTAETIETLESRVRELQKKCELQNVCHEELMLEMTSLKRLQAKQSWSNSQQSSIADGLTSPESSISTPDNVQNRQVRTTLSNGDTNMVSNYNSSNEVLTFHAPTIPLDSYSCGNTSGFGTVLESTSKEIDRILSRIAHDNKVLAELDRPRSALGFSMVTESPDMSTGFYDSHYRNLDDRMIVNNDDGYCLKSSHSMNELDSLQAISERNTFSSRRVDNISNARTRPFVKYSYVNPELDRLMAKLEQDNRVLAELDKTRACIGISTTLSTLNRATVTNTTALASSGGFGTYVDSNRNFTDPSRNILKYSTDSRHTVTIDENAEFLELPGKGQVQVFVAKYTYDPLMHSPNENPEAELSVTSGEYVIVYGDMDEDGFYDGELPDGRRGLVPSNFVIKLTGEDLYDFQTQVLYGSTKDSDDSSASFSQELDYLDDYHLPLEDYKRMNDYVDLEDIEEVDEDNLSDQEVNDTPAPNPPQRLTLEKQLNKSILISWIPPDGGTSTVESYDVYVDGVLKNTVKSQERTRALVEGVDSSKPHRISVRSVSDSGKQSKDAACTITIGKESPLAPAYVTATSITSTSAIISWLPSNSNFQHVICVNSVEVRIVKPGIFRHTITGLAPNTEYRVSVRSKAGKSAPSKSAFNDEKNRKKMEKLTTYVDFRTLPKGLPDPPIDVQVESGPQDGTLLVSWLPVTISATGGTSNGCPVNGYSVYVDGKRMGEIDSPTADHTLLDITSVQPTQVKSVTVRTKSGDSVSADSISCKVPAAVIKGKRKGYDDMADDSSDRDELSDIAEEAEEDLSDTIQAKAAEKKDGRSINKENVDKEKKKSEKRSVKESQSKEVRNSQKSLRSTSKKKSEVIERRNSSDQVVMETEDNLSDKEIIPDMHINIPSIEITKDSASEGRNSIEPFSDEDYDINCSKSQGVSDGRRSERDRQNQQKRVMQNSPVTGSDKCATTYQDKRVTSQVTPQPTPRRSNTGYNNGYGGEEEYSRRESDYNRRDGDYRHDEGHRRDVDYRRDRDYGRRDSEYSRRETGEYSRRHSDYRRETDNIRERERHRPNGPVPYRDQPISNHARLFVALFDYDPQTMSPNPDGADEELPFNEGQIIKIYGDKDNDGFYRGEANGRIGYVPCNMVSEVQAEDEEVAQHLMRNHPPVRPGTQRGRSAGRGDFQERYNQGSGGVRKMVALYDYDPQELSPNFDAEVVELSFNTGDIIYVHGDMDEDGFFMGEIGGVRGLVPSNFLTDVPSDYRDNNPHHNELCAGKIIEICTKEEQEQQQPAVECINPNNKEVTADHTHNHHNMHNYHPNDIRQEEGKIREITTTAEDPSSSIQAIEVDHQVQDSTTRKEEMCRLEDRSFHQIHTIPWIEEDLATSSTNVQDMAVEKEEALVHRLAKDNIQKKFTTKGSHSNVEEKEEEEDRSCPAVMDTHHEQGTIRKWGMVPKFLQRQRNNTESVAEEPAKELHTTIQCHQECHMDNPKKSEVNGNSGAIASKDSFSKKGLLRKHSSKRKKAKSGSDDKKAGESDKKNASSSSNRKGVIGFLKGLLPDRLTKKS